MPLYLEKALEEAFRLLVLTRLHARQRLRPETADSLLQWKHSGFSVFARQKIRNEEPARLAHMARYLTRPPVATERVRRREDGRLLLEIPADHRTGAEVLCLSPHELIHRLCAHIPDRNTHLVRYYGAYANRCRREYRREDGSVVVVLPTATDTRGGAEPPARPDQKSWARLLREIFEVDPLLSERCGAEMAVVAVITDPQVVDRILAHQARTGRPGGFGARGPPRKTLA